MKRDFNGSANSLDLVILSTLKWSTLNNYITEHPVLRDHLREVMKVVSTAGGLLGYFKKDCCIRTVVS